MTGRLVFRDIDPSQLGGLFAKNSLLECDGNSHNSNNQSKSTVGLVPEK